MSKIQISQLNLTTSEFSELNDTQSVDVVGGGNVNNYQYNGNYTEQGTFYGLNINLTGQSNNAYIYNNSDRSGYPYYWYY